MKYTPEKPFKMFGPIFLIKIKPESNVIKMNGLSATELIKLLLVKKHLFRPKTN